MQAAGTLPPETLKILESISEIRSDAVWIWNLQTNEVCRFGEAFYNAFGASFTKLSSPEDWKKLIHPNDKERVVNHYKTAISDPECLRTEDTYHVIKTDGHFACVQEHIYIYRNENNVAITMYGITTDITYRKKNDLERERLISELTRENAELKQFSYTTTHNLRTPIANLIGLGSLIETAKIEDPFIRNTVEKYKQATLNLNKTVNELFNLLVQHDQQENQNQEVALDKVFKQVTESIETEIVESGAEITTDFSAGNTITFNPGYLHSIFLNFLTNSIKYRESDRKLSIKAFTELKNNALLLHFSDNGSGIDLKKYGEKIFGLYQKFHHHPDSKGLGLHIVSTHVKATGGKIWVNSQPHVGTTFTIQFKN
jgi:PAS domain S-box-containing protein